MQILDPIHSRDNALIKNLHRLASDGAAYRKLGQVWLEGEHLLLAYLQTIKTEAAQAGFTPENSKNNPKNSAKIIVAQSYLLQLQALLHGQGFAAPPCPVQPVDDALLPAISSLDTPAPLGLLLPCPAPSTALPNTITKANTVVLDRLQDAGNVGTILRCAAAFGFRQIIAIKGTVALYSPKVLRAAMGAHFALQLHELQEAEASIASLQNLGLPLLATSSHQGDWLHQARLPSPCAWLMGHEGQGLSHAWQTAASGHIRIWQASEESLNVATAAAICLHASAAQAMLN